MVDSNNDTGNKLLAAMTSADFGQLSRHLIPRTSLLRDVIIEAGQVIEHLYFPESGLISLVSPGRVDAEVGLVGREGVVGASIILEVDRTPLRATSQIRGSGYMVPARALMEVVERSPRCRAILSRYVHVQMVQSASTSVANANLTIERRLCRWLLMVRDRLDDDQIELTHEMIATVLNVQRPGLTVATHLLEGRGLIRARRGLITILDRAGLADLAGSSYGLAEAEYDRLLSTREPTPIHAIA